MIVVMKSRVAALITSGFSSIIGLTGTILPRTQHLLIPYSTLTLRWGKIPPAALRINVITIDDVRKQAGSTLPDSLDLSPVWKAGPAGRHECIPPFFDQGQQDGRKGY